MSGGAEAGERGPAREAPAAPDILETSRAGPAAVRGGLMRGVAYLIGAGAGAVSAALLFHHLGKLELGTYGVITSLVAVVNGFTDLGLTAVGVREAVLLAEQERAALLRDLLGFRLLMTTIGIGVMAAIAALGYQQAVTIGVVIAGVGLLLQVTQDNFVISLQVRLRFRAIVALDLLRPALTVVFVALFVAVGGKLQAFVAVAVIVGVICATAAAWLTRGERLLRPTLHWQRYRTLLRDILPYSAAVAAASLYYRVAVIATSIFGTATAVSYVYASFRVIEVLTLVPSLVVGVAFPIFAHAAQNDRERLGYALGKVFDVALIVGAWIAVSIAVGADLVMSILGGQSFAPAARVLAIMGIGLGGTFVSIVWGNALLSLRRHREILLINLGALVFAMVAISVLVDLDGARGAAIGLAAGELSVGLASAILVGRLDPDLRPPLRVVPRVALAAAVALVPLWLTGVPTIARICISTAAYGTVLVLTRALPSELAVLLPARLRGLLRG
jgi:polysaccharide transporter, PST family